MNLEIDSLPPETAPSSFKQLLAFRNLKLSLTGLLSTEDIQNKLNLFHMRALQTSEVRDYLSLLQARYLYFN